MNYSNVRRIEYTLNQVEGGVSVTRTVKDANLGFAGSETFDTVYPTETAGFEAMDEMAAIEQEGLDEAVERGKPGADTVEIRTEHRSFS